MSIVTCIYLRLTYKNVISVCAVNFETDHNVIFRSWFIVLYKIIITIANNHWGYDATRSNQIIHCLRNFLQRKIEDGFYQKKKSLWNNLRT